MYEFYHNQYIQRYSKKIFIKKILMDIISFSVRMEYLFYTFLLYGNYYMQIKRLNDSKPANYSFIIITVRQKFFDEKFSSHFVGQPI